MNVEERFYNKAEKYKKKKEELRERIEKEEIEECTFKPKTNVKESKQQSNMEFTKKITDLVQKTRRKHEDAVERSKAEMQEKIENDENLTLRPKICEKSKEILAKKQTASTPAFERLYSLNKSQAKKQINELAKEKGKVDKEENKEDNNQEYFFQPHINKKSQDLKREEPISSFLYNDAIRRMNKPAIEESVVSTKFLSDNSQKFLIEKFKRDYEEETTKLQLNDNTVNYSQYIELLKNMHFIKQDKDCDNEMALKL